MGNQKKLAATGDERDALIASVVTKCVNANAPPSEIVTAKFIEEIPTGLLVTLARAGLIRDANDSLHQMRGSGEHTSPRIPIHAVRGRNPQRWKAVDRILHVGADGLLKPLLDFGEADARQLVSDSESQRSAWLRRKQWAGSLISTLGEHGAEALRSLPDDEARRLDDAAEKAWA